MANEPAGPSLVEFAASEKKQSACWMCGIPERVEAETAVAAGLVTKAAVIRWLKTRYGDQATENKVSRHLSSCVNA